MRLFISSGLMLLAACSPSAVKADGCANFPMRVGHHLGGIYDLHDASSAALAVRAAKNSIDKCYSKMAYKHSDRALIQKDVKLDESDNSYLISFNLDGVSDIAIAFRANGAGEITEAFEYSNH